MAAVPFDTLKLAKGLEAGGFTQEQARAAVDALSDAAAGAAPATKTDLALIEQRMTIRLGGLIVAAVGVLVAAFRLLPPH